MSILLLVPLYCFTSAVMKNTIQFQAKSASPLCTYFVCLRLPTILHSRGNKQTKMRAFFLEKAPFILEPLLALVTPSVHFLAT